MDEPLPGQNFAPASELGSFYASQDFIPVLDQVQPLRIKKNAKAKVESVRGQHIPQQLIRGIFLSAPWQIADLKHRLQITISFLSQCEAAVAALGRGE